MANIENIPGAQGGPEGITGPFIGAQQPGNPVEVQPSMVHLPDVQEASLGIDDVLPAIGSTDELNAGSLRVGQIVFAVAAARVRGESDVSLTARDVAILDAIDQHEGATETEIADAVRNPEHTAGYGLYDVKKRLTVLRRGKLVTSTKTHDADKGTSTRRHSLPTPD